MCGLQSISWGYIDSIACGVVVAGLRFIFFCWKSFLRCFIIWFFRSEFLQFFTFARFQHILCGDNVIKYIKQKKTFFHRQIQSVASSTELVWFFRRSFKVFANFTKKNQNEKSVQMGIMSSTQQNGFHAKRAKLYNSKVTVVLGKCEDGSMPSFVNRLILPCHSLWKIFRYFWTCVVNLTDFFSFSILCSQFMCRSAMGRWRQRQSRGYVGHRRRCCLQMSSEWINGS